MSSTTSPHTKSHLKYLKITKDSCCPTYIYIRNEDTEWFNDYIFQKCILLLQPKLVVAFTNFIESGPSKVGEILRGDDFIAAFYLDKAIDQPSFFMIDNGKKPKSENEDSEESSTTETQTIFKSYAIEPFAIHCLIQPKQVDGSLKGDYIKSISELMGIEFKNTETLDNYFTSD